MASNALASARAVPRPVLDAPVLASGPLSATAHLLRVARPEGFTTQATQVAQLWLDGEKRTFTIASGPARPYLEFATLVGPSRFKQAFAALAPGHRVGLSGPFGRFALEPGRPAVMLAGHIGIAPFKALLEDAADRRLALEGALLHARPLGDAPLHRELAALADATGVAFEAGPPGSLADAERVAALAQGFEEPVFYVAGSPREVMEAATALGPLGVPRDRVRAEVFAGYR